MNGDPADGERASDVICELCGERPVPTQIVRDETYPNYCTECGLKEYNSDDDGGGVERTVIR